MIQPIFENVIAFDYYDGPEAGMAISTTGDAFRFAVVGETDHWAHRAFTFDAIHGNWRDAIQVVRSQLGAEKEQLILVPDVSEFLGSLRARVNDAAVIKNFIAIGHPDFTEMRLREVNSGQLEELKAVESYLAAFHFAEKLIRDSDH